MYIWASMVAKRVQLSLHSKKVLSLIPRWGCPDPFCVCIGMLHWYFGLHPQSKNIQFQLAWKQYHIVYAML